MCKTGLLFYNDWKSHVVGEDKLLESDSDEWHLRTYEIQLGFLFWGQALVALVKITLLRNSSIHGISLMIGNPA